MTIVLNEQSISGDQITVNAIHITFNNVAVGLDLLNGEIIVSQSVTSLSGCAATTADVSISKTDSADPVTVGDTFSYALTASNAGPGDATSVVVTAVSYTHLTLPTIYSV